MSDDGQLILVGRVSEVINSGGNKISPQLIEEVLLSGPEVSDAAAFGVANALGITQIGAAVVTSAPLDTSVLHSLCRERLKEKAPLFIMQLPNLPRNAYGKILRDELRKMAMAAIEQKV